MVDIDEENAPKNVWWETYCEVLMYAPPSAIDQTHFLTIYPNAFAINWVF